MIQQRQATPAEWSAAIARLRRRHPMAAASLEAGAAFTENGVKLLPPQGFVRTPTTLHGPTVERAALTGEPEPEPENEEPKDIGTLALRGVSTMAREETDLASIALNTAAAGGEGTE